MTTTQYDDRLDALVKASTGELLAMIEQGLDHAPQSFETRSSAKQFKRLLDALHAKLRRHHAAGALSLDPSAGPQSLGATDCRVLRLNAEHSTMLGILGHLCAECYAMSGLSPDEQELFILRARELVAVFRRHKAEEDSLYYHTVWRDVGGEG